MANATTNVRNIICMHGEVVHTMGRDTTIWHYNMPNVIRVYQTQLKATKMLVIQPGYSHYHRPEADAQFSVAEEEPNSPRQLLTQRLGQRRCCDVSVILVAVTVGVRVLAMAQGHCGQRPSQHCP